MSDIVYELIAQEEVRQREMIGLIPSENHFSPAVAGVLSSSLSSKYAEGYPGRRYYEGNQIVDEIENLAIDRLKGLFGVPFVNVQAHSGSPANSAIQFALLEPGDTLMGLALGAGGHLTHGHPSVTFSGRYFNAVQYGLNANARIDFDQMLALAKEHKPKMLIAGTTSYPFVLDFAKFREVADAVGAWLVADISHITALVLAGEHPSPVPHVDAGWSPLGDDRRHCDCRRRGRPTRLPRLCPPGPPQCRHLGRGAHAEWAEVGRQRHGESPDGS